MDGDRAYLLARSHWEQVSMLLDTPCLLWDRSLTEGGYGQRVVRVHGERVKVFVHRQSYELFVGPIPEGLKVDHLCNVRRCIAPAHLEPVTTAENNRRMVLRLGVGVGQTERCRHGHLRIGNTSPTGLCRPCNAIAAARYKARVLAKMG